MLENKPIMLLDMDLTIADTYTPLIKKLISDYNLDLDLQKAYSYFGDHKIYHSDIKQWMLEEIFSNGSFFYTLPVIRGAKTALKTLRKHFDIYILTSPWLKGLRPYEDKYDWLVEHFPMFAKKMIGTSQKQLVYGDILIDDHNPFCKKWKKAWPQSTTASLKYPWTDTKIVDITGKNWTILAKKIIAKFNKE